MKLKRLVVKVIMISSYNFISSRHTYLLINLFFLRQNLTDKMTKTFLFHSIIGLMSYVVIKTDDNEYININVIKFNDYLSFIFLDMNHGSPLGDKISTSHF